MAKNYNWTQIKTERAAGLSIKSLALKHGAYKEKDKGFRGVYTYFRRRLKDVEENTAVVDNIKEKIENKTIEGLAETELELRVEYNKINKYIRYGVAAELRKADKTSFDRLKQLKISSEILGNCRKMDWEIHEIQDVAKVLEQNIESKHELDFSDISTAEIKKLLERD